MTRTVLIMDKQNTQMNASHPETNLPVGYPPQYPPTAFQGPPGYNGYPGPQVGYPPPPTGHSGPGPAGFPVPNQPMYNQPVYNQPGGAAGIPWMPAPPPPLNCPPGLEYLSQIDQVLIHQQIELLEVLTGFETNNKYEIKNSFGQRVYFAAEDTDCCTRNCCGPSRPFTLRIIDNMGQEVITLERPLRCSSCCCPCCLQEIEIQAPPGVPVGYVIQTWHPCLPKFTIQNEKREDVLKISGPCVVCSCCGDVDFEIKSLDEQCVVGKISKHWTGILREAFTDADNFGIQFPLDLDVKMKAVMIGACFLIDFMFFESTGSQEQKSGVW
ncbi:phospholipid scramblase 1 isoform X1 [Rhinopithecus roxellana]|uniref:Phospholipid scramblase n=4 Tax=Rhinopithecus TaxID=542827 RepID=A0AAJ7MWG9_RHIBE|nr:phospholipid scramblase 1 isoform X1 [Rhinopithecus roxellana]XP_010361691.1 phospholipid scramblase 1 isoform X1 [Rhinopithecus roxellana]XP_017744793.1 PREDICTED: phospholipid scramblase 1 isoform X1 [Rhinopithecus bieti]XP_017744794.1 PREDICTED: phospholipid scramblase 1 isoform X1 [Rhinopithecus bieti]XP_030785002.1 phospholipid scramblase 1 isoform X1 [Rhinopithecus roxellana]XP_030785006.1 phospholipid scramblase 1 isoform X1 [Rhinopithecus roxellana]XP_030785008.1 phospholipid scram